MTAGPHFKNKSLPGWPCSRGGNIIAVFPKATSLPPLFTVPRRSDRSLKSIGGEKEEDNCSPTQPHPQGSNSSWGSSWSSKHCKICSVITRPVPRHKSSAVRRLVLNERLCPERDACTALCNLHTISTPLCTSNIRACSGVPKVRLRGVTRGSQGIQRGAVRLSGGLEEIVCASHQTWGLPSPLFQNKPRSVFETQWPDIWFRT